MLWIISIASGVVGIFLGYILAKNSIEAKLKKAKEDFKEIIEKAKEEAKEIRAKMIEEARVEIHRMKEEYERDRRKREEELQSYEDRLIKREEIIAKREETIDKKEEMIDELKKTIEKKESELKEKEERINEELVKIAGMTEEEAKELLLKNAEEKYKHDLAMLYKNIKDEIEDKAEKEAKRIMTIAIQRFAAEHVSEATVTVVPLPSDDMKGRIIGREGRNIRAFEKLTGVTLIVDDVPDIVVLSSFNPFRREIARLTLEKLVADGRIHPARIEEMYEKAKKEIETVVKEAGQDAAFRAGVVGLHPEIIKLLGKLKFRTSYGQNVLEHSIEVAQLAGMMAAELGLNVEKTKRGGLLHDIGKAVDHEVEGSHTIIGGELARRYGEKPDIVNAIMSHHGEVEPATPEAVLVAAADALSAARPGARRETIENYIRRLMKLEELAESFSNVEKAFAIQAGREIRVIVQPDKVDDAEAELLAYEIAKKIEEELEYPGVLKVVVIREKRSVAYAK
ncbi:MAG: ribonuclease Y [Thermotogaceae bacterium]|nr:ribonuclease Y [Thermotogaceae bacterium]